MIPSSDKQQRFMAVYEPLHARLSRFVQTLIWDKEEARDLVSETILRAYEQFDEVRDEQALLGYLFTIAANLVNKKLRRKKFLGWLDAGAAEQRASNQSGEGRLLLYELNRALQKLPVKQYEALVWYEISGLRMEDIANLHGISVEGVKSNLHRARQKMARWLEHPQQQQTGNAWKGVWYE